MHFNHTSITAKNATKKDWKLWEADILVACGLKHQFVTVFDPATGDTLQSFIHGFDLQSSLLLLDGLFPWPQQRLRPGASFWIQIKCDSGFFNLEVKLLEVEGQKGHELLTVRVCQTNLTHNRRWHPRVYFEPRQGPQVELQLDNQPLQTAWIANLSSRGALLEVFGQDLKASVNQTSQIEGVFRFNDHFHLTLKCQVRQSRFLRTPCCHTHIRLQFRVINEEQQAQIDTFIHSIITPPAAYSGFQQPISGFAAA